MMATTQRQKTRNYNPVSPSPYPASPRAPPPHNTWLAPPIRKRLPLLARTMADSTARFEQQSKPRLRPFQKEKGGGAT